MNRQKIYSRDELLNKVWGDDFFGEERTVDTHVYNLRKKLNDKDGKYIQSVWGQGYRFGESGS